MTAGFLAWEQPQAGPRPLPIGTENIEQSRRQHRIPILAALTALDVQQHPLAVDRADLQPRYLADPQACRIGRRQCYAIAQSCNRVQKANDLLRAENRRKLLRLLARDDPLECFLVAEGNAVEEPQRTCGLVDVRPRPLLRDEVELVGADILHSELIRRPAEMPAKLCYRVD